MTQEQKAAYVIAMAACANARIAAMQAENAACEKADRYPQFNSSDFDLIPNEFGIHHNAVIGLFHDD